MENAFTRNNLGTPTSVTEIARPDQVVNSTGGFVFEVDDKTRLTRFLVLGTEWGSYYSDEKSLTKMNVAFLIDLIRRDEQLVYDTVIEISSAGRAFRNSPAIFAVAALAVHGAFRNTFIEIDGVKHHSLSYLLSKVCRTSTHLFEFAEYLEMLGQSGWGRAKRTAVANWYTGKSVDSLAYQVVKYRQRNGWTHRDMLRLSHPVGLDHVVRDFILGKLETTEGPTGHGIITGFLEMQAATTLFDVINTLQHYPELPWETIPTQFLTDVTVWKQLLVNGQLRGQALLRNVTRLAKLGAFDDMFFAREFAAHLTDKAMIASTRLHPWQYLLASRIYANGPASHDRFLPDINRSTEKTWTTQSIIADALDEGFHSAFKFVEPTGKRTMLAVDVSSSMTWSASGTGLMASEVAAAMAVVIARVEPYHQIMGFATQFRDLGITAQMSIEDVLARTRNMSFGATDISLPMRYAGERKIEVDTFVVITDNETNSGGHPYLELKNYRKLMRIDARLVVVACTPTPFTVADPKDTGMLDVVGADSNLPRLIAEFSAGRI